MNESNRQSYIQTLEERLKKELNPSQLEAVQYHDGPLLVLAGAGSGKTRVITYRIAWLLATQEISPWNILAVTFTNKAAGEMVERIAQLIPNQPRGLWIGTFHSICVRILRREGNAIGIDPQFVIYDRSDQTAAIKRALQLNNLNEKQLKPKTAINLISKAKSRFQRPDDLRAQAKDDADSTIAKVYQTYQEVLKQNRALDFDDLLLETVHLLTNYPDVAKVYQTRFQHILVDEYQDTNHLQYLFVRELAKANQNVCAVGDDDQSIYRWRGATIRNILEFERDYPKVKKILLEQNYRSTQTILSAASAVVKHNRGRHSKTLWSAGVPGDKIGVVPLPDEVSEAFWIGNQIQILNEEQKIPHRDMAVFYRTNAQSRLFEEECLKRGIPYKLVGATAFYERKEIKDVLAYCRLLLNPADMVSFQRIVNVPKRKLGKVSTGKLFEYAMRRQMPVLEAAQLAREEGKGSGLSPTTCEVFYEFARLFDHWKKKYRERSLSELMQAIVKDSGYRVMLESDSDPQSQARLENVDELINAAKQHSEDFQREVSAPIDALTFLESFLEGITLKSDIDEMDESEEGVILMTLHSAKGLEFPVVFISGVEEGLLPHRISMESIDDVEEERRLCYVGMTRAKTSLYLTYAESRRQYNRSEYTLPSRFMNEIPDEYIEMVLWETFRSEHDPIQQAIARQGELWETDNGFEPGDMVNHRSFGFGVVTGIEGDGGKARITIDFQDVGKKTLVQEYAKLQKV